MVYFISKSNIIIMPDLISNIFVLRCRPFILFQNIFHASHCMQKIELNIEFILSQLDQLLGICQATQRERKKGNLFILCQTQTPLFYFMLCYCISNSQYNSSILYNKNKKKLRKTKLNQDRPTLLCSFK